MRKKKSMVTDLLQCKAFQTADKPETTDFAGANKYNLLQILEPQNDQDAVSLDNEAASPALVGSSCYF